MRVRPVTTWIATTWTRIINPKARINITAATPNSIPSAPVPYLLHNVESILKGIPTTTTTRSHWGTNTEMAAAAFSPMFKAMVLRLEDDTDADRYRNRRAAELLIARKNKSRRACVGVAALSSSIGIISSDNGDEQVNHLNAVGLMKKSSSNSRKDIPPLISPEKLDEWTRESVVEIVRNTKEGPFLVHVFSNNRTEDAHSFPSSSTIIRLEMEPVLSQNWESIKERWNKDGCFTPDGIILVEELHKEKDQNKEEERGKDGDNFNKSCTRTWGLLVQGRGLDCSACYILNTCRVLSSVGASTHFCIVKAKCFDDSADVQVMKAWLQQ